MFVLKYNCLTHNYQHNQLNSCYKPPNTQDPLITFFMKRCVYTTGYKDLESNVKECGQPIHLYIVDGMCILKSWWKEQQEHR